MIMNKKYVLNNKEIAAFHQRFMEERKLNRSIISAIHFATYKGKVKLFDVEIDTVKVVLRSEMIKESVKTFEGFKELIDSGIISTYEHVRESVSSIN